MSDEAIEGIDLRGQTPAVRQARKGPIALVAILVFVVLSAMAYALYQRSQPTMTAGTEEATYERASDISAAAQLTARAPDYIKVADETPLAPVAQIPAAVKEIEELPAPAAGPPPAPIDPAMEEARKAAAELRKQAIEASMEVPLGLGGYGGNLAGGITPAGGAIGAGQAPQQDRNARILEAVQRMLGNGGAQAATDPNGQSDKAGFIDNLQKIDPPAAVVGPQSPANPYVIRTGTTIPMTLITGVNSDLPGMLTAQVSQHVYDTPKGRYVLIPQGTRLVGQYDSRVTYGQDRLLVVWNRLIYPDGSAMELGGMPGADQAAQSGLADKVDNHYFRIFGSALLLSVISAGFEIATNDDQIDENQQTAREAVARQMSQVAGRVLEKNLNIQPTITIRNGQIGSVMVNKDLYLRPWNPKLASWASM